VKLWGAIAVGVVAFTSTAVVLFALTWGWFALLLILAATVPSIPHPEISIPSASLRPLGEAAFIANMAALAVSIVALPIWLVSAASRRFGTSSAAALLTAGVLMGVSAVWFVRQLTFYNNCLYRIEFPPGDQGKGCLGDGTDRHRNTPPLRAPLADARAVH
jgi:hypothetical protein